MWQLREVKYIVGVLFEVHNTIFIANILKPITCYYITKFFKVFRLLIKQLPLTGGVVRI